MKTAEARHFVPQKFVRPTFCRVLNKQARTHFQSNLNSCEQSVGKDSKKSIVLYIAMNLLR